MGRVDDKNVVDLDYNEEAYEDGPVADIPMALIPSTGEISLLQMEGEITKEDLIKALETGKKKLLEIYELQKKALKEKFK